MLRSVKAHGTPEGDPDAAGATISDVASFNNREPLDVLATLRTNGLLLDTGAPDWPTPGQGEGDATLADVARFNGCHVSYVLSALAINDFCVTHRAVGDHAATPGVGRAG